MFKKSRTHFRLTALITTLLLLTAVLAADPLAVRYYEDAVSRFNTGDHKGAVIQLKNALQRDPAQLSAKILLGRAYLALGQPRLAEEELQQAQQLGADTLLTALPLARARNRLGRFEENIEEIVPTRYPRTLQPDLWTELGLARLFAQDPAGAQIAFDEAQTITPGHIGSLVGLARIPLEEKRFDEAAKRADRILAVSPENAEAWYIRGASAHARGQFDEAAKAYGRAYELDPLNVQAALGEAAAMLEGGDAAKAAALLAPLRGRFPANATIPYLQGEAFKALGEAEKAEAANEAASSIINAYAVEDVAHQPGDLLLFGTIAFDSGQLETAYRFLSTYVETRGSDVQGRKLLGKTLLGMGKPGEAQRVLVRISTSQQADAESLALLGDALLQLGDKAAAERYYRDALQNHRGGPAVLRRLGMTQFYSGQREQALDTLQALVDNTRGRAKADNALLLGLLYYSENRLIEAGGIADTLVQRFPENHTARNLQGLIAIARGDAAEGRQILETILGEDPGFRPARYNLIKLDIAEGRYAAAETALRDLRTARPNDTRALLESARFALTRGDRRGAIDYLEKAREIEPDNVLAVTELINTYLLTAQISKATARALDLNRAAPNDFLAKDALARVHIAGGDYTDAAVVLKEVARLAGDNPERLVYTARLQTRAGANGDAHWSLTKALAIEPENVDTRIELATVLYHQREYPSAAAEVRRVLEQNPRHLRALALLGDLQMVDGRIDDAITTYRKARSVADTAPLIVSLHRALMTAGRENEALRELQAWHDAHPGVPVTMGLLASHLEYRGQAAAALALRESLVERTPDDADAWRKLAVALSAFDNERALKAALRASELAPNDADVLDTLGWTFIQLGQLERGLSHLREALSRDAGSPTIRYHLGVALQEYGNLSGARTELEQALRLSETFPERDDAVARLNTINMLR